MPPTEDVTMPGKGPSPLLRAFQEPTSQGQHCSPACRHYGAWEFIPCTQRRQSNVGVWTLRRGPDEKPGVV